MAKRCLAIIPAFNEAGAVGDVIRAISGHLCRCGTYPHVVSATLDAAKALRE